MSGSAVGYAVAAAICFALASALQHQAATGEQGYRSGIGLLWRLARNRRWAAGLAAAAAGIILHAAALHAGALAVVQPVLLTSLALALPVRALLDRARPSAGQALAAAVLAAGVAVFVIAAHPSAGRPAADARGAATAIVAGAILAGLCSMIAARARSGRVAGFALGLAAGILYGLTGGALKATVHTAMQRPAAAVAGWPLWALVVLGAWAFIIHQRAYTHAPLRVSLPALSVANPLAGMAFGAMAFAEIPASGPLALLGEALGLVVIITSVTILVRPGASVGSHHLPPAVTRPRGQDAASVPAAPSAAESPGTAHGDGHPGAPPA